MLFECITLSMMANLNILTVYVTKNINDFFLCMEFEYNKLQDGKLCPKVKPSKVGEQVKYQSLINGVPF